MCHPLLNVMPVSKVIAAIAVNILVPLLGGIVFVLLCRRMRRTHIQSPPFFHIFILFVTYGGWLMVFLTALCWEWSGMASLGVVYLVLIAPFVTAGVAFNLRGCHTLSVFHRLAYIASAVYSGLMVATLGVWAGIHFFAR
jgi:hypothetical protein